MDTPHDPDVGFFQLVQDLQRQNPDATPVGSTGSLEGEMIRFRANPTFAFPPAEVSSMEPHPSRQDVVELRLNLIGLYGPASPLPTIFTERVLDAEIGRTVADFLDLFNHRFAGLLVLIWKHYRHDLRYRDGASDALSLAIGSLFGLLPRSDPATDRERVMLLPYTGLLAMGSRSAESASRVLGHFLGLPCQIEEFVPRRIELPPEARFTLGGPLELGVETLIGESVADATSHCRVWIGPMSFERYRDFLPDGRDFATVQHAIDFVINEPLSRDLGITLQENAAPDWGLGDGKLGWTSWIAPPRDRLIQTLI